MASISSIPITHSHARSISLPSRSSQLSEFNKQLCRSQASEATTSSSSIGHKINGLKDLYISIDNLLLLPRTQRALLQDGQKKFVNELLDEFLRLLELCSIAKEAVLIARDSAQELQSVMRRKRGDVSGLMCAIQEYQSQRRKLSKDIKKALRDVKSSGIKKNQEAAEVATMLKEVNSVTFSEFESFFSFILGSKSQEKLNGWFSVTKLMSPRRLSCGDQSPERSEIEKVDAELYSLINHNTKRTASLGTEAAQKELTELELGLQVIEEGLECLYRHLIKTRVSLLNTLN